MIATFVVDGHAVNARVKSAHMVILLVIFKARKIYHPGLVVPVARKGEGGIRLG